MPNARGDLLILTGPPGSGKTTIGRLVVEQLDPSVDFESDWFWHILRRGYVEPWSVEAHDQNRTVIQAMAASATTLASGGYHVVVNGIIGPWQLDLFLDACTWAGVEVHYTVLRPSLEVTLARATARWAPQLVDEGPIRQMWEQFADLAQYEPHVVDNTALDVHQTLVAVLERYRSGSDRL